MTRVILNVALLIFLAASGFLQDGVTCECGNSSDQGAACLTETQMSHQVKHIEMEPDRMGHHLNLNGVAVFELIVGRDGHVVNARAISGHPLAISLLIGAMDKWRFKPLLPNETVRQVCGRLSVKFSIVQNLSKVEVVRP
jgi:hypothetical protein